MTTMTIIYPSSRNVRLFSIFVASIILLARPKQQTYGYKIVDAASNTSSAHDDVVSQQSSEQMAGHLRRRLDESRRNAKRSTEPTNRPVVYTFFQQIKNGEFSSNKYDDGMIEAWSQSWYDMGWEPRVLTLEDAKKHPKYKEYNAAIDNIKLDFKDHTHSNPIETYNRLCYLRWLAMAAAGGGFMADYDTVAISPPKPGDENPGIFTLYDNTCPALLSGSGDEWERLAWLILEYGIERTKETNAFSSDMVSLKGVYENKTCNCKFYKKEKRPVINALSALSRNNFTEDDCQYFQKHRAVHFSHHMVSMSYRENSSYTYGMRLTQRPDIMKRFSKLYKEQCFDNQLDTKN